MEDAVKPPPKPVEKAKQGVDVLKLLRNASTGRAANPPAAVSAPAAAMAPTVNYQVGSIVTLPLHYYANSNRSFTHSLFLVSSIETHYLIDLWTRHSS